MEKRTIETITTDATERATFTIEREEFTIVAPFTEGMELSAGEAAALNQLLRENIRNNAKTWISDESHENRKPYGSAQEALDAYVASYAFGATGGGGRKADPLTQEMRIIVAARLQSVGMSKKDAEAEAKAPESGFRTYLARFIAAKQGLAGDALAAKTESAFATNFEKIVRKPAAATVAKRAKTDDLDI